MSENGRTYTSSIMIKRRAGSDPENDEPTPVIKPVFAPFDVRVGRSVKNDPQAPRTARQPDPADQLRPAGTPGVGHPAPQVVGAQSSGNFSGNAASPVVVKGKDDEHNIESPFYVGPDLTPKPGVGTPPDPTVPTRPVPRSIV